MREIKFRGIGTNGQWVYGDLKQLGSKRYIIPTNGWALQKEYLVKPESVGQLTGLLDKAGVEIYEGDICRDRPGNKFRIIYYEYQFKPDRSFVTLNGLLKDIEVIGNIYEYETPELLKETK